MKIIINGWNPNLSAHSVVVTDNVYHNMQNRAYKFGTKVCVMKELLCESQIPFSDEMLNAELYDLIKWYKDQHKHYTVDLILKEFEQAVLRLPP
jgi:hypothetical protein